MYQLSTRPFGTLPTAADHDPIPELFVYDARSGQGFSVLPDRGAMLRQLVLLTPPPPPDAHQAASGQARTDARLLSVLRTPDSPQALLADESYASALLFPFPGRLRHGIYTFEGEAYTLPMNEGNRDNALHGLVYNQPFVVLRQQLTETTGLLTLRYDYDGQNPGYPFPCTLDVTYTLTADTPGGPARFSLDFQVTNTGTTPCPVAFGWHPYFSLNAEPLDDLLINLPAREVIELDDQLLPTGNRLLFHSPGNRSLQGRGLNTVFVVDSPAGPRQAERGQAWPGPAETVLTSASQALQLTISQDASFPYLVVFTPPRRDAIAIEPMTASVNAFNTDNGLRVLEPGDFWDGTIQVRVTAL